MREGESVEMKTNVIHPSEQVLSNAVLFFLISVSEPLGLTSGCKGIRRDDALAADVLVVLAIINNLMLAHCLLKLQEAK